MSSADEPIVGSTTCCKCPVCTCGPDCACPKGEGPGCDPCGAFMKEAAASAAAVDEAATPAPTKQEDPAVGSTTCCKCPVCTCGSDCACPKGEGAGCDPCAAFMKEAAAAAAAAGPRGCANNDGKQDGGCGNAGSSGSSSTGAPSSAAVMAAPAPPGTAAVPLTSEEQQAVRKARRDRARETKLMQNITKIKSAKHQQKKHGGGGGSKRRWGRGRGKNKSNHTAGDGGGSMEENAPDLFDEWLGAQLTAWSKGTLAPAPSALSRPPEGSGVTEEVDFDPSKDEIGESEAGLPLRGWGLG